MKQNVDSADHIAHTAYLSGLDNGKCPSTHPVPLMKLFYEVGHPALIITLHDPNFLKDNMGHPYIYFKMESWH